MTVETEKLAEAKPKRKRQIVPRQEVAAVFNTAFKNWTGTATWMRSYNPDDLVREKGQGIRIYQEMTREPFVKAALQQKITMLLSVPWDVKPAGESPEQLEQAKFVRWNLKQIKGGFGRDVWEICDALVAGYSILEKVWDIVPASHEEYGGKVRLAALKSKDPYYFGFDFDEYMNLKPAGVVMAISADGKTQNTPLPSDKFFIFAFMMKYENLYGQSDMRAAYRAFWIKDTAWKLRAIYMERFSGNSLKGKYPRSNNKIQQDANKQALLDIFKAWQNETGVAIPEDLEIEVLQIATSSDSEYARAMADCNVDIAVGILGETLTINEGRKTGARNMGEIHKEVVDLFVLFLDMILTADINEQIVRDIVDQNYAGVTEYPEFYFYPREDYDPVAFGEAIGLWQAAGAKISKAWFYEKVRMPLPSGDDDVLKPMSTPTAGPGVPPSLSSSGSGGPPENKQTADSRQQTGTAKLAENTPSPQPSPQEGRGSDGYYRELDKFEKFAEIPKVDLRLRRLTDKAIDISRPAYEKIFAYVLKQVENKGVLASKDFEAAAKVAVNPAPLKDAIFRSLLTAHMLGRGDGVINLQNQGYDFGKIKKFAEVAFDWEVLDEPFTPEEAVKFFSGKVPMTSAEFEALAEKLMSEAFYVTGLEKLNIEKDVKALLTDALKNGMTLDEFKFKLNEMQVKYATPVYGREGTVGQGIMDYHVETVFRTNMMGAYNAGRREMYGDPDVKAYFPAYEYTAIMDGRTSDICMGLDGKVYLADDPVWNTIWPPNHFNCRSTVVTVNKYDFNQDMISEKPGVEPAKGFGG
jgi:SPP1 gp7 family putative phage head morphogenesis protein